MKWHVKHSVIGGSFSPPGDKSIAHRGLLMSALARGESTVTHLPDGQDVASTMQCLRHLGIEIDQTDATAIVRSLGAMRGPAADLDLGNSGTTTRLLSGILAGQEFTSRLTGDESLSRRPMERVAVPLRRMGASITTTEGRLPMEIRGGNLDSITYLLPVASAQVKSAILFAALFARGATTVREPIPTRDHTERLFNATGIQVTREGGSITVEGGQRPAPISLRVPGDLSSAAFLLAGAALTGGRLTSLQTGVNPTRAGILAVLAAMGAEVAVSNRHEIMGEPVADVTVSGNIRLPIEITGEDVPRMVDELPLIALLATQADGTSVIRGAQELRWKEVDRIAEVVQALSALGADIDEQVDGFVVRGPTLLSGTVVSSRGDHRLAMMLAVAGCVAAGETTVTDAGAADVSFPGFHAALMRAGGAVDAA